jgi:hypothetical protein
MHESSSDLLVHNCDEYYSYNSISGLTSAADGPTEKHDPWVLAGRTILKMEERKDVMRSDRFKQVMLELDPSFDEKEIGFSKFNRFLTEAASRGILSLEKAANGQYEVAAGSRARSTATGDGAGQPTSTEDSPARARSPDKRSRSRSRNRRTSDRKSGRTTEAPPAEGEAPEVDEDRLRNAYTLLADVTGDLAGPDSPVRDSEVKRQMLERDGKFDEAALGFRKFSRFLRQAHDEGIVDLERGPEGNYLVSPLEKGEPTETRPSTSAQKPGRSRRSRGDRDKGDRRRESAPRLSDEAGSSREDVGESSRVTDEDTPAGATASKTDQDAPGAGMPARSGPEEGRGADESEKGREAADSDSDQRRTVGMGRFRRGSRSRAPSAGSTRKPGAGGPVVPGPVDAPPVSGSAAEVRSGGGEGADQESPREKPAAQDGSTGRSVSGRSRGRGGSRRGPGRSAEGEPAGARDARGERTAGEESDGNADRFRAEIEAMSRNYPGVGRRTAEVLFREFGDRVYAVIDEQPERIRAVLPEHRAKAVLAGREAERSNR